MTDEFLSVELREHARVLERTASESRELILQLADLFVHCFEGGGKLLLCGNGGSAADAQHVAAEFVNRFRLDRAALPAIALTTDSSILTCIGNDLAFESIFSRQVEALSAEGDILVGISTSGRSANVLKALDAARARGVTTVGFTGQNGLKIMSPKCDYCLAVCSADTARIQECQIFIWHVICGLVEDRLYKTQPGHSRA
jgi:D-sedoheptulose 7-phosphate isomerase